MRLADVPVVGPILAAGADDPVFDALLLAGPLCIAVVAVAGRRPLTVALAATYLLVFVGYVAFKWLSPRHGPEGNT